MNEGLVIDPDETLRFIWVYAVRIFFLFECIQPVPDVRIYFEFKASYAPINHLFINKVYNSVRDEIF